MDAVISKKYGKGLFAHVQVVGLSRHAWNENKHLLIFSACKKQVECFLPMGIPSKQRRAAYKKMLQKIIENERR